jgi:N-carbamoylputrescine amidase
MNALQAWIRLQWYLRSTRGASKPKGLSAATIFELIFMTLTRIAYTQWPDGLLPRGPIWQDIHDQIIDAQPSVLITNEMPFGSWLAESNTFIHTNALLSVALHEEGIDALHALEVPLVISSRPVWLNNRSKLANEAFALINGDYVTAHQKHYLPEESGFHETVWFDSPRKGFQIIEANGVAFGVLLCTELMFNEHARHYGRYGAHLIAVPRASGRSHRYWDIAGAMAAVSSGSFVVSSNRTGRTAHGQVFGGHGFVFAPDATRLPEGNGLITVVEVDLNQANIQKSEYPCYVAEL